MNYNFVLVHLGSKWIPYLFECMAQIERTNPAGCRYWLIISRSHRDVLSGYPNLLRWSVQESESLPKSFSHWRFNLVSGLDRKSLGGFWHMATERFFYLDSLVRRERLNNVFHLENDNLLYADLSPKLETFQNRYQIGAVFDNDDRCIPGFLYVQNSRSLKRLTDYILNRAKLRLNDMQVIARFRKEFGPDFISSLPLVSPRYGTVHPLVTPTGMVASDPSLYSNNYDQFDGVFDAAALGQYLGGIDVGAADKKVGFVNESCVYNPSYFTYEWATSPAGHPQPVLTFQGQKTPIYTLHVHSKNLAAFAGPHPTAVLAGK